MAIHFGPLVEAFSAVPLRIVTGDSQTGIDVLFSLYLLLQYVFKLYYAKDNINYEWGLQCHLLLVVHQLPR